MYLKLLPIKDPDRLPLLPRSPPFLRLSPTALLSIAAEIAEAAEEWWWWWWLGGGVLLTALTN